MSLKDKVLGWVDLLSFLIDLIGTGKSLWESGNPAFGFPLSHGGRGRGCGNVEIAGAISKGSWAALGNLGLVFPRHPQPGFSPSVLFYSALLFLKLPKSFLLAACILIAAPTSLSTPARRSSRSMVRSPFKDPATVGVCRSISHGVAYHLYVRIVLPLLSLFSCGTPHGR